MRPLVAAVVAASAAGATAGGTPAAAAGCDQSVAACRSLLQADGAAAANQARLNAVSAQLSGQTGRLLALTALITRIQAEVGAQDAQIAQARARQAAVEQQSRYTGARLSREQAQLELRRQLLAQRVRALDKHGTVDYLQFIVSSGSFSVFVDRVLIWQHVISSDQQLVAALRRDRDQVQALQAQLDQQAAEQAAIVQQIQGEIQQERAQVVVQQSAFDQLRIANGQARLQQEAASARQTALLGQVGYLEGLYQQELAQRQAAAAGSASQPGSRGGAAAPSTRPQPVAPGLRPLFPWVPAGGFPDDFPYGQCTYWAAYNHRVTWIGNARDWLANARAQGARTSSQPSVGAVVVWGAVSGYSIYGHVAVVIAVGDGMFTVSEMNYVGVGIINTRLVLLPDPAIEGFIF